MFPLISTGKKPGALPANAETESATPESKGKATMMETMHPSLTTIIVTSSEAYALVAMVAIGIVGMAIGILILEAIVYHERK